MAEVLKLAARPTPYDKNERTWLEVWFKLENYLTPVNEKYVAIVQDADSQPVANVLAGSDESSVLIRTLSRTLWYALLATLTTGRSLRLVQRVPNRDGFEVWRQPVTQNAPKTAGRRFAISQAALAKEARRARKARKGKVMEGQKQNQDPNPSKDVVCWHCGKTSVGRVRRISLVPVDSKTKEAKENRRTAQANEQARWNRENKLQ